MPRIYYAKQFASSDSENMNNKNKNYFYYFKNRLGVKFHVLPPQVNDKFPAADPIISFLFTPGPCTLP